MRTIKFKGKRVDNGEWIYGNLINKIKPTEVESTFWCSLIHDGALNAAEVIPETVGQFTGLTDKNGVEIFEGDILQKWEIDYCKWELIDYEGEEPFIVTKKDVATMEKFPCFWLKDEDFGYEGEGLEDSKNWEVIGNIHENPQS